jgi:GT2 family glycosyltransferase
MARKLDVGIAVYSSPGLLAKAIASITAKSQTEYRLILVVNPHPDAGVRAAIASVISSAMNPRIVVRELPENVGYAGAVNEILACSESEYIAYCDEDVEILTPGWDETLCSYLDRYHELGFIAPNGGAYPIKRPAYTEVLWAVGFCWAVPRAMLENVGFMDVTLGHHEEVDWETRIRMAGYTIAAAPEVHVSHNATASNDPASMARINKGVQKWVTKWCNYHGGANLNYHSPNVLRFEDWPTSALHMEQFWLQRMPALNDNPEVITVEGREYDLVRVPRLKGFYRGRII